MVKSDKPAGKTRSANWPWNQQAKFLNSGWWAIENADKRQDEERREPNSERTPGQYHMTKHVEVSSQSCTNITPIMVVNPFLHLPVEQKNEVKKILVFNPLADYSVGFVKQMMVLFESQPRAPSLCGGPLLETPGTILSRAQAPNISNESRERLLSVRRTTLLRESL
jgi:hypothetical protein